MTNSCIFMYNLTLKHNHKTLNDYNDDPDFWDKIKELDKILEKTNNELRKTMKELNIKILEKLCQKVIDEDFPLEKNSEERRMAAAFAVARLTRRILEYLEREEKDE